MSDRIAVMHAGSIRQIGGPHEIYDQPAERFVADFIGDTNFLEAELLEVAGDVATVRLPSGKTVPARASQGIGKGKVTLAIRPEHANLSAPDQALLPGVLSNVVYFGTDTHFHVTLEDGETFVVRAQNQPGRDTTFAKGDATGISFPAGVGQVLRD